MKPYYFPGRPKRWLALATIPLRLAADVHVSVLVGRLSRRARFISSLHSLNRLGHMLALLVLGFAIRADVLLRISGSSSRRDAQLPTPTTLPTQPIIGSTVGISCANLPIRHLEVDIGAPSAFCRVGQDVLVLSYYCSFSLVCHCNLNWRSMASGKSIGSQGWILKNLEVSSTVDIPSSQRFRYGIRCASFNS